MIKNLCVITIFSWGHNLSLLLIDFKLINILRLSSKLDNLRAFRAFNIGTNFYKPSLDIEMLAHDHNRKALSED